MNQPPYQQPSWGPQQQPGWGAPPPPLPPRRPDRGKTIALVVVGVIVFIGLIGALAATVFSGGGKPASSKHTAADKPKAADPSKLDDAGKLACDDFAHGYKAADTRAERLDLAHKVNKWAPSSKTDRIKSSGHYLANGAAGSDGAWKLGADAFAQACLDAGWKA